MNTGQTTPTRAGFSPSTVKQIILGNPGAKSEQDEASKPAEPSRRVTEPGAAALLSSTASCASQSLAVWLAWRAWPRTADFRCPAIPPAKKKRKRKDRSMFQIQRAGCATGACSDHFGSMVAKAFPCHHSKPARESTAAFCYPNCQMADPEKFGTTSPLPLHFLLGKSKIMNYPVQCLKLSHSRSFRTLRHVFTGDPSRTPPPTKCDCLNIRWSPLWMVLKGTNRRPTIWGGL